MGFSHRETKMAGRSGVSRSGNENGGPLRRFPIGKRKWRAAPAFPDRETKMAGRSGDPTTPARSDVRSRRRAVRVGFSLEFPEKSGKRWLGKARRHFLIKRTLAQISVSRENPTR